MLTSCGVGRFSLLTVLSYSVLILHYNGSTQYCTAFMLMTKEETVLLCHNHPSIKSWGSFSQSVLAVKWCWQLYLIHKGWKKLGANWRPLGVQWHVQFDDFKFGIICRDWPPENSFDPFTPMCVYWWWHCQHKSICSRVWLICTLLSLDLKNVPVCPLETILQLRGSPQTMSFWWVLVSQMCMLG